jgi:hypothetical protein
MSLRLWPLRSKSKKNLKKSAILVTSPGCDKKRPLDQP